MFNLGRVSQKKGIVMTEQSLSDCEEHLLDLIPEMRGDQHLRRGGAPAGVMATRLLKRVDGSEYDTEAFQVAVRKLLEKEVLTAVATWKVYGSKGTEYQKTLMAADDFPSGYDFGVLSFAVDYQGNLIVVSDSVVDYILYREVRLYIAEDGLPKTVSNVPRRQLQ